MQVARKTEKVSLKLDTGTRPANREFAGFDPASSLINASPALPVFFDPGIHIEWQEKYYHTSKRFIDIIIAALALFAGWPIFGLISLAIVWDSHGSPFFSQIRVGRNGKYFNLYKFRSMNQYAARQKKIMSLGQEANGKRFKIKADPRITRIGKLLRRFSLDELPQLWNILRGDMSVVGPRPSLPGEVALYTLQELQRLRVKPGLTCIWQVNGRSNIPFEQQVQMDIEYIQHRCNWLDFKLLLATVPAVLTGRGAC